MTFADVLKAEMAAVDMSSELLARKIGVSQVTVNQWRRGCWQPKVKQALALARLFGRPVESMFPDEAQK